MRRSNAGKVLLREVGLSPAPPGPARCRPAPPETAPCRWSADDRPSPGRSPVGPRGGPGGRCRLPAAVVGFLVFGLRFSMAFSYSAVSFYFPAFPITGGHEARHYKAVDWAQAQLGNQKFKNYCLLLTAHRYNIILIWAFSRRVLIHSANCFCMAWRRESGEFPGPLLQKKGACRNAVPP